MYESFYQLTTNPFRLAPDPKFCFSHSGYKGAREYLEYALDQGEGFVMVTGRPGTGKTLLLETFLKELDTSNVVARRIAVSNYSGEDLLRAVAYAYDIDAAELDKATIRHRIQQYFLLQEQAGRRVLLIIDEAQALRHTALEELRILADLQTQSRLMLQLFLVGQESLQDLMSTPDMEQFQQRVIANYHLIPLNLIEVRAYIEHRLLHAGWGGDPEFTSAAVLAIYQLSKGVPRHINKICNRLLLLGFGKGSYILDREDVQAISVEMREEQLTPMEANRTTLLADSDAIASIPEIRDGLISLADLAIRVDKVDADTLAIFEASRLAAREKEAFITRHNEDPVTWLQQQPSHASPVADPVAVTTEQLSVSSAPEPVMHGDDSAAAGRTFSQPKWGKMLVVTSAMLAVTALSIAALPSLSDKTSGSDTQSRTDHQTREIQDTAGTGLSGASGDELIANEVVAELTSDSEEFRISASDKDEGEVIADRQELDTLVVISGVPDAGMTENIIPVPVATDRLSWVNNPGDSQPLENEPQVAVAEALKHAEINYPSSVGTIDRHSLSFDEAPPAASVLDNTAAFTETVEPTDSVNGGTIKTLLEKGWQSKKNYRLMTPEDDNAYGYFNAVLQLDPANEDAHAGIQEIVDVYVTLVRKEADRHDSDRASRYLERALSIQPANRELLAMKDSIDRAKERESTSRVPAARSIPATQRTVSAGDQSIRESMILGIKTFFKKRQAEGRRGEVRIPVGWDG
ncbi:MAG: AAA family ATPase [Pseudomonadota bacterium]